MANLVIMTADELMSLGSLRRQAARRSARQCPLVQLILRTFLQRGGPIPVEDTVTAFGDSRPEATHNALAALDDEDIIRVRAGPIDIAYPFSAVPTPFRVRFSGGRERHACCATDALGMASMIGERVEINSPCHHCGALPGLSRDTRWAGAWLRKGDGLVRQAQRRGVQGRRLALNDDQLLPVGRTSESVARREPDC